MSFSSKLPETAAYLFINYVEKQILYILDNSWKNFKIKKYGDVLADNLEKDTFRWMEKSFQHNSHSLKFIYKIDKCAVIGNINTQ